MNPTKQYDSEFYCIVATKQMNRSSYIMIIIPSNTES